MNQSFKLISKHKPAGDQPRAIQSLVLGLKNGLKHQTLLGVTGSGKSVVADTPVLIRDSAIGSRFIHIGEYIDGLFEQYVDRIYVLGDTEIVNVSDLRVEAYSLDINTGVSEWRRVIQATRHRSPSQLWKIKTSCGRSVVVTGDHNFFVLRNGKIVLIPTTAARVGDYLPVPRNIRSRSSVLQYIDIDETLLQSKMHRYYISFSRGYEWTDKALMSLSRSKQWRVHHHNERVTLAHYISTTQELNVPRDNILVCPLRGNSISVRQHITHSFLRFLGYYIAEGHATDQYIVLSSADTIVIEDFLAEATKRGMHVRHRSGTYDYQCNGTAWADILSQWCGSHSKMKKLPPFWMRLTDEQLAELLRAYFSADGGVERDIVSAATASMQLASDILYALLRFGIVARAKKRMVRVPGKIYRSESWRVVISGRQQLLSFQRYIGFVLERKNEALVRIIRETGNTNVDVTPISGDELRELRVYLKLRQKDIAVAASVDRAYISMIESGRRQPSCEVTRRLAQCFERYRSDNKVHETLVRWSVLADIFWTSIEDISITDGESYVYDFAVEQNENFLAGHGGLFVHNTFTVANVIEKIQKPTLVIAHNKTLAAQLTNEFRELFPHNSVNYFVSYYDYYQPEAYMPSSDTYIDKEALINDEIDKLRHAATTALLTRRDVIVVASVSCIYGLGAPEVYAQNIFHFKVGDKIERKEFARKLIQLQFSRTSADLKRGTYRLRGDNWEIMPPDREVIYNFELKSGTITKIYEVNPVTGFQPGKTPTLADIFIAPAKHFITMADERERAIKAIQEELRERLKFFEKHKKFLEAERLERRTKFDIAMMREVGYCHGIENYSRHLSGRREGEPPDTLLDYFQERRQTQTGRGQTQKNEPEFLTVIDESHITVPQLRGMYAGDRSRKETLVEYGFRLPSAIDNRPLTFSEFSSRIGQVIYTSATPGPYELEKCRPPTLRPIRSTQGRPEEFEGRHGSGQAGQIVEQIIRPTGLVDPKITIRPARGQIDDLIPRVEERAEKGDRVLVTTLTKKMAEDLSAYLEEKKMKVTYLHSDVKTLDRIRILTNLRKGSAQKGGFDVLVGVNLLREGLDLPEVSLVAILDADKEGFLRSDTSLIQTIGRASRNVNGEVLIYADQITGSIKRAVGETERRRELQLAYNKTHGITPKTIIKAITDILPNVDEILKLEMKPVPKSKKALDKLVQEKESAMREAAKDLNFELAALLRDEIKALKKTRI